MNITFDTNCLVSLENKEDDTEDLHQLVVAHDEGRFTISVPGIIASELLKDGTFARNFSVFRNRIDALARREFEILRPPLYLDITYLDWSILGEDETIELERKIHDILFPRTHFFWTEFAKSKGLDPNEAFQKNHEELRLWRNRKCDILVLWCHIYYDKDIFVTSDKNFHKLTKRRRLEALGAKQILYPSEAVKRLDLE